MALRALARAGNPECDPTGHRDDSEHGRKRQRPVSLCGRVNGTDVHDRFAGSVRDP